MSPFLRQAVLAVVLALIVLLAVSTCQKVSLERELAAAKLAPAKAATDTARAKVDTVTIRLAGRIDTVKKFLARAVRVDTFMLAPVTSADTARAVAQLPTAVASLDTLTRSCSALVLDCAAYRTAAENRFRVDSTYRATLEAALRGQRPSRLGAIWNSIKLPLAVIGGVAIGVRVH